MTEKDLETTAINRPVACDGAPPAPGRHKNGAGRPRLVRWLVGRLVFALIIFVLLQVLSHTNFLGELVQSKVQAEAEKVLSAKLTMSPLAGNPVTGFTASNVEIMRSGDRLLFVKNIGVDISMPSLLRGKPRVSLIGLNGVDASLDSLMELLPKSKKESDKPTDIPIDAVLISDSTLRTKWGDIKFEPSHVYIDSSFYYNLDLNGAVSGKPFAVKGVAEKIYGKWTTKDFSVKLAGGTAQVTGVVYPSVDVSVAINQLNLTDVAELVPRLEKYGVVGMLSGSATFAGDAKAFTSRGKGLLQNAVIRGIPLEQLDTEWDCAPGRIKLVVDKGRIFNSTLTGNLSIEKRSDDTYLELAANVKNLKFADWSERLEKQTHGKALFFKGGVSSLKADIKGPLNALSGRVDIGASDVSYKDIALKGLSGSAVFNGEPAGLINLTAMADGRRAALSGRISLGDKIPSDMVFSTDGYPIEKVLKCLPDPPKMKVAGTVSLKAACRGLYGKWRITAEASSPLVEAQKIGKILNIKADAAYNMADKKAELVKASAEWNGAQLTGAGAANLAASSDKGLNFQGSARGIVLTRFYDIVPFFKSMEIEGAASGKWRLTGTAAAPVVAADVRASGGKFRGLRISNFLLKLAYAADKLYLSPMDVTAGGGRALLTCNVNLPARRADGGKSPASWKLSGKVMGVDLTALNGLLKMDEEISGVVTGAVTAGSDAAGALEWGADFTAPSAQWRDFRVVEAKGVLSGNERTITVKNVSGTFLGGATTVAGAVSLPAKGEKFTKAALALDVTTEKLNVYELLRRHLPDVRSIQGLIAGKMKVTGTVGDPKFKGGARVAPIRCRGFMLPMLDTKFHGTLSEIVVSEANALIQGGSFKAYGRFYAKDKEWYGDFNVKGASIELRQFGSYLPEGFKRRFGGIADFDMSGKGKLKEITGKGAFSSPRMRIMGIRFDNVKAPFFVSNNYAMIEDLKAGLNGGTLEGGVGFDLKNNVWGGNLTVMSTDINQLIKQAAPRLKGNVTGTGDLKVRGGGEIGRSSTIRATGAVYLHNGEITSFDAVESAKKYTGGKPLLFESIRGTFTYDGGDINLLPGSQATAPKGDPVYRYVMLDGFIGNKGNISLFSMGKVNIRALNSFIGAFQGLLSAGMDMTAGTLNKGELLQNVLGGVLSGFAKNEFRFVTFNIGGTTEHPQFFNVKVEKAVNQTSAKEAIPTNQSDPDEKSLTNNGNTTFKFKFEIPVGPGYSQTRGDAKGQVVEQTLENLLKNVDFGL